METKKMTKTDRAVERFAAMMIETIEGLEQGWRKTWLTSSASGRPMNASGREYSRMNEFFLAMVCAASGYELPVFVTFNQCREMGAQVKKGEKSFPVLFWNRYAKNSKTGETCTMQDYALLSKAEQKNWNTLCTLRSYDVFNVEQTTLAEVKPEMIERLKKQFTPAVERTVDGMYTNKQLDALIGGAWVCPIICRAQNDAYYSPTTDSITLPTKEQFNLCGSAEDVYNAGQAFYACALHEMAHSTGKHLNREDKARRFGDKEYGREELVAELTAAMCGHELGFNVAVQKNNAAYLSSWLKIIKQEPSFLISVLADVSKATNFIDERLQATA